ncbi:hypothetical protein M422DRAFT_264350 [Sphaerobolus stellatus SS14]|uniref:NADP-dependent oxidoreductase domain-containing protein n=1 Tax=Sphaerobolus stellatus (strain SS14) TaxID=990650 RepID=A0A0C9V828_SPHS4|nr:hypothetical protein M422DRAFT_264350 [Sphaerobolus stellatus SS14]
MASLFQPAPPSTKLGRYRILSPNAGVRVSPIAIGGMSFGAKWKELGIMTAALDKEASFKLLDAFFDAGGNFIDTANNYQDEESEAIIGEWTEKRGIRDQLVIATKYTMNYKRGKDDVAIQMNYTGNSLKSLHLSVEASLRKLRTSYIDILYVHWWAWDTSIREIMNGLHSLVMSGKVLYLGISDTPAWVVAKANEWARSNGKTPFSIYQGRWSILDRAFEREIIPMAREEGLALAPWGVLGQGRIRTDEEEERRKKRGETGDTRGFQWIRTPDQVKLSHKLEEIAKEVGAKHITAVALAYVLHKTPYVYPIMGVSNVEQLEANLKALDISLTPEHIKAMESVLPFEPGFPHDIIGNGTADPAMITATGNTDRWMPVPALPSM